MSDSTANQNGTLRQWVTVRAGASGGYTAQAAGLPQMATAPTREEAIKRARETLNGLLASGELVSIEIGQENPLLQWAGRVDPNDPNDIEYLEELARQKQLDLENTLRELDQECSNSSSTPTT